jgi:hypothetical protein
MPLSRVIECAGNRPESIAGGRDEQHACRAFCASLIANFADPVKPNPGCADWVGSDYGMNFPPESSDMGNAD